MFDLEKIPAYLRTVVPTLWGTFVAWLIVQIPAIPEDIHDFLTSPGVVSAVAALAVGLWYAFWRWLEPHLPAWATRLVLGSNLTPSYDNGGGGDVVDGSHPDQEDIDGETFDETAPPVSEPEPPVEGE